MNLFGSGSLPLHANLLDKIQRVRMLETQSAWKRKGGFDRIETMAVINEEPLRRLNAGFDPEPFHTGLNNH